MRTNTLAPAIAVETRAASSSRRPLNGNGNGNGNDGLALKTTTLLVGFDWGTNKCCLQTSLAGQDELLLNTVVPTLVGYASEGIVDHVLPGNARMLFGHEALKRRLHLRLVQPMVDGVVADLTAARDFARHLRVLINPPTGTELRAVIGLPANADRAARENMRQAVAGLFDKVIMIPEPFLAALGYRDESRLNDPAYVDPVNNSLFVDIGGGTTDLCLIQGYYPTADDQLSLPFAGDKVDALLGAAIRKSYPEVSLSLLKVREIKEQHSYVGTAEGPITVDVVVSGKRRQCELSQQIGEACAELLEHVCEGVRVLIERASSDSVTELLGNIVLTGGGSRIRGLGAELQRRLAEEGYETPRVLAVGEDYKQFVARGALKAARLAKESQWQQLIS